MTKNILRCIVIKTFLFLTIPSLFGQAVNIRDFDQPGTYSYIVPAGITELVIECWGGGGGGSAAIGMLQGSKAPGAGGGGGAHAHGIVNVTPGQVFTLVLGAGGAGGKEPYTLGKGNGLNGQNTYVSNSAGVQLIVAEGGKGASFALLSQGGSKRGIGGRYTESKGAVIHTGGAGADASTTYSGGGGGGGGRVHEGYNAVGINAGSSGSCYCGIPGAGGRGLNTTADGNPGINTENPVRGVIYASGGGGGGFDAAWGTKDGGKGANGHIRIKEQQVLGEIKGNTNIDVGQTTQLIPPVSGGQWRSSLINIASVDQTGLVTGLQPGVAVISYIMGGSVNDQSTEIQVTVYPAGQGITIMGLQDYCTGGSNDISLQASTGANDNVTWYWTGPNNFYSGGSSFTREAASTNAGTYTVTATRFQNGLTGTNLIANGSFESGNTGFTSSYAYNASSQDAGHYNVNQKPNYWSFKDGSCGDHTSGNGNFLSLMGNNTVGTIWKQTITVEPNTDYQFSYWTQAIQSSNENVSSTIKTQVQIAGNNVGSVFSNPTSKNCIGWSQFIYNWNSGSNTSAEIKLNLAASMSSSYMIGVDDIVLRKIDAGEYSVITSTIDIGVGTSFAPNVQITVSPTTLSPGVSNKFIASAEHGGMDPTYIWTVNNEEVQSGKGITYISSSLAVGDVVRCELIPDKINCTSTPAPYYSNAITMNSGSKNYWYGLVSDKWYVSDNWTKVAVPNSGDDVEFATMAKSGFNVQEDLEVTGNIIIGDYVNESSKKLVVSPGASLTINDQINTNNENRILVQASETAPNGTLIFKNAIDPVFASVEMWSKSRIVEGETTGNKIKWQYFGVPVQNITASPTFNGAYIRKYNEGKASTAPGSQWDQLLNASTLLPFEGYEIAQQAPAKYTVSGLLVKNNFSKQLSYTAGSFYKGQHVLANPYTAAIDISKINFGEGLEKTIYIFNTGSYEEWTGGIIGSPLAGSFTAIPQEQAESMGLNEIPSMQGFLARVLDQTKDKTLSFNYNDIKTNTLLLKSAQEKASLKVTLESKHYNDQAWVFLEKNCTPDFDNGWDGYKMFASNTSAQLCVVEGNKSYQVSSTNNLDGVILGLKPGEKDTDYTLRFDVNNLKAQYTSLFLIDLETGDATDLLSGDSVYSFHTLYHENIAERFQIVSKLDNIQTIDKDGLSVYSKNNILYVNNSNAESGQIDIYDLSGLSRLNNYPFAANTITEIPVDFRSGVYIVKIVCGEKHKKMKLMLAK